MNGIIQPLRKYADFNGRASRAEFWTFVIFVTLLTFAAHQIDAGRGERVAIALNMGIVELSTMLLLLLPTVAVGVRRLHDTGRSGWWMMLVYLPWLATFASDDNQSLILVAAGALLLGGIVWIVMMILPGETVENAHGQPPA